MWHGRSAYPTLKATSDSANGSELVLTGWSLSHGLSNLLIDGALDHLPGALEDPDALVRQFTLRALGPMATRRSAKKLGKVL